MAIPAAFPPIPRVLSKVLSIPHAVPHVLVSVVSVLEPICKAGEPLAPRWILMEVCMHTLVARLAAGRSVLMIAEALLQRGGSVPCGGHAVGKRAGELHGVG